MKKNIWNYLMIGSCFIAIALCFIPFFKNECCLPGYDQNGSQIINCSYSWDSILSRFASVGSVAILLFVLYLVIASSAVVLSIINDLLRDNRKLLISSIVLTALTALFFFPVLIFASINFPTC